MAYLGGITASLMSTVFIIFLIAAVGYLVGGISIKGISLGSAGVLLIAWTAFELAFMPNGISAFYLALGVLQTAASWHALRTGEDIA